MAGQLDTLIEAHFFFFLGHLPFVKRKKKKKIKNKERLKRNHPTGLILFFNSAQCVYDVRLGQSQIQCCSFFFSSLSILARLFSISLRPISSVLLAVTTTLLSSALYFFPDIGVFFSFFLLLSALETSATKDRSIYKKDVFTTTVDCLCCLIYSELELVNFCLLFFHVLCLLCKCKHANWSSESSRVLQPSKNKWNMAAIPSRA